MLFEALMAVAVLALPQTQVERAAPVTAEGIFREGVEHWGDSTTDAVVVTVVDQTTGAANEVCVGARNLVFAVAAEQGVRVSRDSVHAITDSILASKDRRFTFAKPAALAIFADAIGQPDFDKEVCGYLRRGIYAFRFDRSATVEIGRVHD